MTSKLTSAGKTSQTLPGRVRRGMKLVRIWVPDSASPEFRAEALRQSRAVARSPRAKEDQEFVDAISVFHEE
jgi:hypothetical protein